MEKTLIDEVFTWSFDDILSEELYKDKVENIPDSFNGVEDYFGSFIYPLLEETRAQLSACLNNISKAPYAEVVSSVQVPPQNGKQIYDIKVNYWRNLHGVRGNFPYKICPGDILLFTDFIPETDSDLQWLRIKWTSLAKVQGDNHSADQTAIRILANSSSDFQREMSSAKPLFVAFMMNLRTNERILNSLQMDANVTITNQVLGWSTQDDLKCGLCSSRGNLSAADNSVRTLVSELNKSQREVVFDILSKTQCNHRSSMELIWGPPGTGKTKTLSILLFAVLKMKYRTLICAPTDIAIVELASRVLKLVKEFSPCSLGGIVYFGDDHAAKVDLEMKEIYMDYHDRSLEICLQTASLVFSTASNAYILQLLKAGPLKLLIIDESGQLKEAETSIPLQIPGCRHIVLFGDHHQLRASVTSNVSARAGFARSLFERSISMGHSNHILKMQYRMHPSISFFPNKQFYANQIVDVTTVRNRSNTKCFLPDPMFGPYSFINVSCGYEEVDSFRCSFRNMVEVSVVIKILRRLFKVWSTRKQKLSVGVISPFIAQVVAIKEKLGRKYENIDGFSLNIDTIEGFQGGEEDIIILSTVTAIADLSAGFTSSTQRTNVALTRARFCLWIVGDAKTLSECNSIWKFIIQDAKNRHCFYDAEEDQDLASVILEVKKELDQFDSFLHGDSILFKNARWKVLFSFNFRKSFDNLKSSETKKLVLNLLLRLSCGWRPRRGNSYCNSSSLMLRQFKVKHMHIICSIDIQKDSYYIQVLKVWDILPMEGIAQLVNRLDSVFKFYEDEFVQRCKTRCLEGDLEVPMSWSASIDRYKKGHLRREIVSSSYAPDNIDYVENCQTTDSLLLMKFYSLSSGVVSHLLSSCEGNEMDLPFDLTDEEKDIVLFKRSSFILGRSGCGKTTVLIMKLFQKEQLHHLALDGFHEVENDPMSNKDDEKNILRQVFVTVSPRLCYSVGQYISRQKRWTCRWNSDEEFSKTTEKDIDEMSEFSDIPDSFASLPKCSYPLVITFKKFLMMLNGTVGRSFFERFPELKGFYQEKRRGSRSITLKTFIRTKEVDYGKFCSSYWSHFSIQLTQQLDKSLVYTEIISHIKGGFRAGVNDDTLSREDYISYSGRRLYTLTENDRGRIYDIFVQYENKKSKKGEFDVSDIVIDLHRRMRDEIYEGEKMDFVYIDEVQDLTMRQISLFKYVCRNFEEGFVFSGDTAQTIVRGIDFKFQNIRALFYKEFGESERQSKGEISDVFQLRQNFRTHAGVLKLANSILELLYYFFPASIDKLQPESSLLNGQKPVWLQTKNGGSGLVSLFKSGSMYHAFGAEQVILVRDEHDKKDLFNLLGKQALVLTVMECKGLEFDDVLLYNFFSASLVRDQWDVIYGYMKNQNLLGSLPMKSFPSFEEGKHIALCSELKQLYVAITRTRQRLWIFDNESISIFKYWDELCLVQVRQLDEAFLLEILVESSREEWKARGIEFFHQKNYEKAIFCFQKACETYWSLWAEAAYLRCTADSLMDSNFKVARIHLIDAALAYESIAKSESAAQCFLEAHEYEKAGMIYLEKFGDSKLEEAAECFSLARSYEKAAEIYVQCKLFGKCLSVCTIGKLFETGYKYIQSWKLRTLITEERCIKNEEIQRFLEEGACHYNKIQDSESMMKFIEGFESENQMRTFLRSKCCLDELMLLEIKQGNFYEATEVANMKGDILREADLLEITGRVEEASKLIVVYVLYNSLWVNKNKGWPLKHFEEKEKLLKKAKTLAMNGSWGFYTFISCMANFLLQESDKLNNMQRNWNDICRFGNVMIKILCARRILDLFPIESHFKWFVADLIDLSQNRRSWEKTSIGSLVYYWNFWHGEIEMILESLQDHRNENSHTEFCENYFGVRKQLKEKTIYLLLYPNAEWVNSRFVKRKGELQWIDADQFVQAVKGFWSSEMVTVGVKVIEILKALYTVSVDKDLSLFCQCMLLIQIYKTAKPLIESKNMKNRGCHISMLQSFLKFTVDNSFGLMYQLDWRKLLTKDIIYLREKQLSWKLLIEICSSPTKSEEIGMLVTAVLSVKFHPYLFKQIEAYIGDSVPWKDFIECLRTTMEDGQRNAEMASSSEDHEEMFLVQKFHDALKATDFIEFSPSCFCYFLDRLLLMVSSLKGYFFALRCSLVEWLIFLGWRKNLDLNFVDVMHLSKSEVVNFVAGTVKKLLGQAEDMLKWIKKYNLSMDCYPELVLRLFVILAILCVNFGGYSGLFFELLGRREITSLLPWKFYRSLKKLTEAGSKDMKIEVLAEAFKEMGNPLVTLNMGLEISVPHAIFLELDVKQYKESILKVLGLKNNSVQSERTYRSRLGGKQLRGRPLSLKINDPDQNLMTQTPDGTSELQHSNKNFWIMLGSVVFEIGSQGTNFTADVSRLKKLVLDYIIVVNAAMKNCSSKSVDKCEHRFDEENEVVDELQQLHSAMCSSLLGDEDIQMIQDVVKKLLLIRETMEPRIDQLLLKTESDLTGKLVQ